MTETISSSFRMYYENGKAPLQFGRGDFVRPPCAVARFPKEISAPPREWVERGFNVQHWTEMPRGGHFAAMEEPELLDRTFARSFGGFGINPKTIETIRRGRTVFRIVGVASDVKDRPSHGARRGSEDPPHFKKQRRVGES